MQVTFYLTQASADTAAGPFDISGTTSGGEANTILIQSGVSKATLLTGYTEEIANNITGGTVTSTDGTCNTTDTWSIDELYTLAPNYVSLEVYGSDEYGSPGNVTVFYTINGESSFNLVTNTPLSTSCQLLGTITGLTLHDAVVISTVETYPISGAASSTCPTLSGTATTYNHNVGASSGTDYAAFSINSNVSV